MWLASFAFSFPNYWTAKLSRCNDQVCLRDDQRSFCCCCFNECGHLELVNIAWKHPSRQEVEMWFGGKIIWKITLRRVDAVSGYFLLLLLLFIPAGSPGCFLCLDIFLPVCGDTCWCRAALGEKKKTSCPVRVTFFRHRSHLVSVCCCREREEDVSLGRYSNGRFSEEFQKNKMFQHERQKFIGFKNETRKPGSMGSNFQSTGQSAVYLHFNNDKLHLTVKFQTSTCVN